MKDKQAFIDALDIQQDEDGHWYVNGSVRSKVMGDVQSVWGNVDGWVGGDVKSTVLGSVKGNVVGDVWGIVEGSVKGDVWGSVKGDVEGSVWGDVGDVRGDVEGDVLGNVNGKINGRKWMFVDESKDEENAEIESLKQQLEQTREAYKRLQTAHTALFHERAGRNDDIG